MIPISESFAYKISDPVFFQTLLGSGEKVSKISLTGRALFIFFYDLPPMTKPAYRVERIELVFTSPRGKQSMVVDQSDIDEIFATSSLSNTDRNVSINEFAPTKLLENVVLRSQSPGLNLSPCKMRWLSW